MFSLSGKSISSISQNLISQQLILQLVQLGLNTSAHPRLHLTSRPNLFKVTDNTTVVGVINNSNETIYRSELSYLSLWCMDKNLQPVCGEVTENKVNFRKEYNQHPLPTINGAAVEKVSSLCTHLPRHQSSWNINSTSLAKKAQ